MLYNTHYYLNMLAMCGLYYMAIAQRQRRVERAPGV